MSATIGQKVRFFRTHRKMSQFDLELAIDASNGSISRIENDQTNPTKETLESISKILELNLFERNYLFGFTSEPASEKEIELAQKEVNTMMRTPGILSYLIDDRARMIDISDSFLKILNIPVSEVSNIRKISLLKLIFDSQYKVIDHFDPEFKEEIIYNFFQSLYSKEYFFINDPVITEEQSIINSIEFAKKIWNRVISEPILDIQDIDKRIVPFKFSGKTFPLVFSNTPLLKYNRFILVEYAVTNEFRNLIIS